MSDKKKGLGGLSPEKRKRLKELIMQRVKEALQNEAKRKMEERDNYVKDHVKPIPADMDQMPDNDLRKLCREFYSMLEKSENENEDWALKLGKQEHEINELQAKVNDVRGRFVKPVLKKVSKEKKF